MRLLLDILAQVLLRPMKLGQLTDHTDQFLKQKFSDPSHRLLEQTLPQ